jgi:hypothetical protein
MCFITGKYSKGLPAGGMIGYVLDGKVNKAIASVKKNIDKKYHDLCLKTNTSLDQLSLLNQSNLRETNHVLERQDFTIHHIFCPFTF